jgi:uncharacterized protein (TIGR02246 family)
MAARTAQEIHDLWNDAFNRGDVDALTGLYEDGATFLAQPGQPLVHGKHAIREALRAFLAAGAAFKIERTDVIEGDDLALVYSMWTLKGGSDAEGKELDLTGQTTDVVRRQSNGTWLFALDNPYGVQAFPAAPTTR